MKKTSIRVVSQPTGLSNKPIIWLLPVLTVLFFISCEHNSRAGGGGGEGTITVTAEEGDHKYFSLTSGKQVSDPKTDGWDIGFQRPRSIVTNGGDTAATLASGGKGMVWYTDKTDFDAVALSDAVKTGPLSDYFADKLKWIYSMSTNQHNTLNVINFTGYDAGSGTEADPFKTFKYDQKQFYTSGSGYPVTNMVYIVQHGDGVHYSKIQVSRYEYANKA
ncbi:MAG: HmuY family protein, partial [Spirochaetaceae bacterium]|nr:HmuY family protein [Spirochaetaceae bacterium]